VVERDGAGRDRDPGGGHRHHGLGPAEGTYDGTDENRGEKGDGESLRERGVQGSVLRDAVDGAASSNHPAVGPSAAGGASSRIFQRKRPNYLRGVLHVQIGTYSW
jgi:hypothetical protein